MKNYLYHFVPKDVRGTQLYPLSVLKKNFLIAMRKKLKNIRVACLLKKLKFQYLIVYGMMWCV
jgi:hypothetical protein